MVAGGIISPGLQKKKSVCGGKKKKKPHAEQRNQSLFKEKSARILQPCDSRTAHRTAAPEPACLSTTAAPDGAEDADFCGRVLLRLCAAMPPEHALSPSAGIQLVQSGTGELQDACFFSHFYSIRKLCSAGVWRLRDVLAQKASV